MSNEVMTGQYMYLHLDGVLENTHLISAYAFFQWDV